MARLGLRTLTCCVLWVSLDSLQQHNLRIEMRGSFPQHKKLRVDQAAPHILVAVAGQGAFGKVFQVMHKATGQIYAMKVGAAAPCRPLPEDLPVMPMLNIPYHTHVCQVMRKDRILAKDHGEYVRAERDLLTSVVHPYIVTLRFSFQVGWWGEAARPAMGILQSCHSGGAGTWQHAASAVAAS
jgi:hypothetical protein